MLVASMRITGGSVITLGMILGKMIPENPRIVVMLTKKVEVGNAVEVESIKIATIGDDKIPVLLLTI